MYDAFTCGGCDRSVRTIAREVGPITVGVCCHSQASHLYTKAADDYSVSADGVVRWNSNGRVPPADTLAMMVRLAMVTPAQEAASAPVRKAEDAASIAAYVAARQANGYSAEERAEMRAAFGDEPVVDIFTGQRVQ